MKIGCVILAGGKSSRMGTDKALLELNGKSFIKQLAEEFDFFEEKMIARGNNESISNVNWTMISDIYQERGPIGGLHTALSICKSDALFCITCDMPLAKKTLAEKLFSLMEEGVDAIIVKTEDDRIHPLCGIYRKSTLPIFEEQIQLGNHRMMSVLDKICVKYVTICFAEQTQQLMNVNTPREYEKIIRKI